MCTTFSHKKYILECITEKICTIYIKNICSVAEREKLRRTIVEKLVKKRLTSKWHIKSAFRGGGSSSDEDDGFSDNFFVQSQLNVH